ncbi:undecaprenyl/decaprenyl-phosphate alpha-N-acetylglucosaminyl 1-phosphate transferase [Patescibacteria group bacterium]|nr:undecaprenyl/decaprenyl-phosphate alpha-N-acetylglucosaminyl 1-phosphate transferase [Patescibacteria group bacterium]MBU1473091.1 undecaprenyl/decaprenyl-phosphate alpha-N-acetylglucosaminyl 1-phosphate transferase [Patescibacteria group bacterium]MBU2459628.1 undecaprenyl/decaprenyl-phosphate alpha-N-acetylglucosaminyl 1-phosphate transferase [Patescibacteria group bacterium]MBU2544469.1 undecaprenyl/decaprenyl-phosphate alpha-N-acetylglucosaminyl 1-phosphate transferase [Patescibacteria gr
MTPIVFFEPLIIAAAITFFSTALVKRFAHKLNLVDDPKKRYHPAHTHKGVIPRAGGLALFAGIVITMLLYIPLSKLTFGIIIASVILMLVGLADDKKDINPYIRLTTNVIAALTVIGAGAGIPYITNPLTGGILPLDSWRITFSFFGSHSILVWADILAFIWIMWTMNIVGWSAGVDGQMPGFVTISAFALGLLSLRFVASDPKQIWVSMLAFIVCGAYAGFLPWNFYPQKIMPGYGGKTLAGFFLALLGILSFGKFGTALLVLGVPMIDAAYTLFRRLGSHKSPMLADRGHLHHRLLDLGWGKRRIALFYWSVSAILGWIALTVNSRQKLFTFLVLAVVVGGFLIWMSYFSQLSKPHDQNSG